MKVTPARDHTTRPGPSNWFTGKVWIDPITAGSGTEQVAVVRVSFEPGARTAWHSHPAGQTLHVLAGAGRIQKAGEPAIDLQPGDTVWIEPGERHWHGAAPKRSMTHLAVQAESNGRETVWYEPVADQDYTG